MTYFDWAIVIVYLLFAMTTGVLLARRSSKSTSEFFLAGRNLPWWIVGTSMVATTFAADTPLAITEMVRGHGIWRNWWWWNIAMGGMLGVFLFSRLWRRAEVMTDNELIEIRYSGRPAAFLRAFKAGWFATVYNFIVMGWVINGMSTVIAVLTGVDQALATWVLVMIAVVYTVLSGFWGVVITDLVQFLLAMIGSIILAIKAVSATGGMRPLLDKIAVLETAPKHVTAMIPPLESSIFADGFLSSPFFHFTVFITLMWWSSHNADGGGYIIQRMSSCKNEKEALKATLWFNVANYSLRVWPWILVALVSLVLFPTIESTANGLSGHKLAYPLVLDAVLGPGLKGLLVTTFLAAFMSTIDTHLNWGASYIVNDIYRRFYKSDKSEKHYVGISRLTILLLIAISALLSGWMTSIERAWVFVWAMGAGIGLVLILRWFWWRINAWSEITALGASIFATFGLEFLAFIQSTPGNYKLFATAPQLFGITMGAAHKALFIVPFAIICWVTVTLLTKPEPESTLRAFYKRVRPGGAWGKIGQEFSTKSERRGVLSGFFFSWAGGVCLIYGLTFGIGQFLFLRLAKGGGLILLALIGGFMIKHGMSKQLPNKADN
jgi:solute:Na+ symporter, SSS family